MLEKKVEKQGNKKINKKKREVSIEPENNLAHKVSFNLVMAGILNFSEPEFGFSINRFANSLPILLKFDDFSFNGHILFSNSLPRTFLKYTVNKM